MEYVCLHDRVEIANYFEQDPFLHIYGLGDLDDFFWPYTTWYGARSSGRLRAVALVYAGPEVPTLVGLCSDPQLMAELLRAVRHLLPGRFYAHFSPGIERTFENDFQIEPGEPHHKMALVNGRLLEAIDIDGVHSLTADDLPDLNRLYRESYPGNWFDPRMVQTGKYFGVRDGNMIQAVAGIHVYSPAYRVAALGNITTHPDCRNRGLGTRVTAALCRSLHAEGLRIGLNVQADNAAAIASYRKIGFEIAADYGEFVIRGACQ
jgi:RimJ/RimL family protein N-acetyltransferase